MVKDLLYYYFLLINIAGFSLMVIDKQKAIHQQYRIPEKRLFLMAWLGGSAGVLLAMKFARHKTLHNSFRYGIPAILFVTYGGLFLFQKFVIRSLVTGVSFVLDKAENGGALFYFLYPFIFNRSATGTSGYWSSFWIVIASIVLLSISYYFISRKSVLVLINLYLYPLILYKCVIGVIHADSLWKALIMIALPLSIGFVRGFVLGFAGGIKEEYMKKKSSSQKETSKPFVIGINHEVAATSEGSTDQSENDFPSDLLQNPEKYGFIPTGSMRLHNSAQPIEEEEKVYFPKFGVTFYHRENLPEICEVDMNKVFYQAGITVGSEVEYVKDITHGREMKITHIGDLEIIHQHLSIGDELIFQVVEGRGTVSERTQSIYLKIESHINLVK